MKTPYLLGIITVLLFGSFALSGFLAEAGPEPIQVEIVVGNDVSCPTNGPCDGMSTATCPSTHKLIGGGIDFLRQSQDVSWEASSSPDFPNNQWVVDVEKFAGGFFAYRAYASCLQINFPMGGMSMIGGELLDIDNMTLFIGAIGVNPVITGLVAITMGGVAAQAIWYVNSRRVKKVE